ESAGSTRMFKGVALIIRTYFRLRNRHVGVTFQQLNHRRYPICRHLHVRVKQYEIVGFHGFQYGVVSASETQVAVVLYDPDGWVNGAHERHRVVGRTIVAHDKFDVRVVAIIHRWKEFFQKERSEEHTSELQSRENLVCRLLLEKKKVSTQH